MNRIIVATIVSFLAGIAMVLALTRVDDVTSLFTHPFIFASLISGGLLVFLRRYPKVHHSLHTYGTLSCIGVFALMSLMTDIHVFDAVFAGSIVGILISVIIKNYDPQRRYV